MNTKTKLTALLMSILMIVAMIPAFALTASAAVIEATDVVAVYGIDGELKDGYASLEEAWAEVESGETYKLLANTSTFQGASGQNRGWEITNGLDITLDLNGFVLTPPTHKHNSDEEGHFRAIIVKSGGRLTIIDSNPTAVHKYTVDAETGLYTLDDTNGTVEIPGGVITGGDVTGEKLGGGAIFVQAGYLEIRGGNFIGNTAGDSLRGGAIAGDQLNNVAPALVIRGGFFVGNTQKEDGGAVSGLWYNADKYESGQEFFMAGVTSISGGVFDDQMPDMNNKTPAPFLETGYGFVQYEDTEWFTVEAVATDVPDRNNPSVIHKMRQVEPETVATCEIEGRTGKRKCDGTCSIGETCTYEDGGEVIPAKGHNEVTLEALEATCTKKGLTEGKQCSTCNEILVKQTEIPALGHTAGDWTVGTPATETTEGVEYKYCTVCNDAVDMRKIPVLAPATEPSTTPAATTPATTAPATTSDDAGCASVVGSAVGMILVALLGGCVILRKKED